MSAAKMDEAPASPSFGLERDLGAADPAIQVALLAAIVQSSDDAIVSKTLDGRVRSWNDGAERLFGYTADEIVGQPITIIIPDELRSEETEFIEKIRRGERVDHFDTIRLTKDGRRIPISVTISPVRNAKGIIIGASKVARDISERAGIEELRRQGELKLAAEAAALAKLNDFGMRLWRCRGMERGLYEILDSVADLLGADKGLIELHADDAVQRSAGAQRGFEQLSLDALRTVTSGDACGFEPTLRTGARVTVEDTAENPSGSALAAAAKLAGIRSLIATPLLRLDGALLGVLWTYFVRPFRPTDQELRRLDLCGRQASDFIQRCALERALHEREDALRDADRRKDEFLALLAHELRNPLAPIRYALAAAKRSDRSPEQQRRGQEVIERQVTHMSRLLDDLLEVSRITRGTLELKRSRTELATVIGTAIESARPILDAKHHDLLLELPEQGLVVDADPVRLAQVFSNLLINAAKYTDAGGRIKVRVSRESEELVISISDSGIGMAPEAIPKLFTLFAQDKSALARSEGGLGVGLALVRGLVLLHGGHVEARSAGLGKGSEFVVRLPLDAEPASPGNAIDARPEPVEATALRILVVDDSRDATDMCSALLRLSGHSVRSAYSGGEALELMQSFAPNVVLLDIGLPDMSGYEVARQIRTTRPAGDVTLVAITGWGQASDRRQAFNAGFDHHLTKPVDPDAVLSLLRARNSAPDSNQPQACLPAGPRDGLGPANG